MLVFSSPAVRLRADGAAACMRDISRGSPRNGVLILPYWPKEMLNRLIATTCRCTGLVLKSSTSRNSHGSLSRRIQWVLYVVAVISLCRECLLSAQNFFTRTPQNSAIVIANYVNALLTININIIVTNIHVNIINQREEKENGTSSIQSRDMNDARIFIRHSVEFVKTIYSQTIQQKSQQKTSGE